MKKLTPAEREEYITQQSNGPYLPVSHHPSDEKPCTAIVEGIKANYPFHKNLYTHFEEQVYKTGESLAIRELNPHPTDTTYRQLLQRVNQIASAILAHGDAHGQVIGIYQNQSVNVVASLLACWKVGAIYLPIDRSYPLSYCQYVLEDANAQCIITDTGNQLPSTEATQIFLDQLDSLPTKPVEHNLKPMGTDTPAMLCYTSGSTGRPKGVVHTQKQVINRLHWMWHTFPFEENDRIAQIASINVMPSLWELLGGLLYGTPTVIIPKNMSKDPLRLASVLCEQKVSYATFIPSLMKLLIDAVNEYAPVPKFSTIIVGGEPVSQTLIKQFKKTWPEAVLINDFGATETNTILYTAYSPNDYTKVKGKPINNVTVCLVNNDGKVAQSGEEGELWVSGPSLAWGYWNKPDTSQDRFVQAALIGGETRRWYKTGDMGVYTEAEGMVMVGRRDHQVKINGMRVELYEVEAQLSQHPDVEACAVMAQKLQSGRKRLYAAVVLKKDVPNDKSPLITFLEERLPQFMVPRQVTFYSQLPKKHNGKIDRLAIAPKPAQHTHPSKAKGITKLLAEVLEADIKSIDLHESFLAQGLDSITAVEFVSKLSTWLDRYVPVSIVFDYPNLSALTQYLDHEKVTQPKAKPFNPTDKQSGDIAIIGIAGRFPQANNINDFWKNLCDGVNAVDEVPKARWDVSAIYASGEASPNKSTSKWGGFLDQVDAFEPAFFKLSPKEAKWMDPQHRLVLEEAWHTFEDAGYSPKQLAGQPVGVFVGAKKGDYKELIDQSKQPTSGETLLGNDPAMVGARVAYLLDLKGPNFTIDTACSSSLVAIHQACQSLRLGDCDMALAGGVCVTNNPDFYVATSQLGVFSPTGASRAFDEQADGFVHGEGVAFVLLKSLKKAREDQDHIYATIKGSAINHDGRSNGLAAPNGHAQASLQKQVYDKFNIDPDTLGYVEAHGTGTKLGDPIEVNALNQSFRAYTQRSQYCAIGTVKTNLGHLTAAAGVTGLAKATLCLHHKQLVPSLHFEVPNHHIDFANSPFYVNTTFKKWEHQAASPRRAAVNAFGMAGTNAHVVLEEAPTQNRPSQDCYPFLVTVTAKNGYSLKQKIINLLDFIDQAPNNFDVSSMAYTLNAGRDWWPMGWVFVCQSIADFKQQLSQALDDTGAYQWLPGATPDEAYQPPKALLLPQAIDDTQHYIKLLHELAQAIVSGYQPDWVWLYTEKGLPKMPLPGYPYHRQRLWAVSSTNPIVKPVLNTSGDDQPRANQNDSVPTVFINLISKTLEIPVSQLSHDDLLEDLGFDSIKAQALKVQLEKALGRQVSVETLLHADTLGEALNNLETQAIASVTANMVTQFKQGLIEVDSLPETALIQLYEALTHEDTAKSQPSK